jgi:hypothetical protein
VTTPARDLPGVSAADLLHAWERAAEAPAWIRPVALLAAAWPGAVAADLAGLSVGERDRHLLALRRSVFGPEVEATAECPACGERAQLELSVDDLHDLGAGRQLSAGAPSSIHAAGYDIAFRAPNTADLSTVAGSVDADAAALELLARCVLSARGPDGDDVDARTLPRSVTDQVSSAMAEVDPLADLMLRVACPGCGCHWAAPFDVSDFLWREVEAWVEGTLREVDLLARAYGWPEPEILALTPARRRRYVELAAR